jgi:AcrR family transcriptional regulator
MARTVNPQLYAARRDAILDAAQHAIFTQGYEQMAIAGLVSELHISSGAFYHYFASKPALLEALVHRLLDEALGLLRPIAQDPHLGALEKLRRYFATVFQWRTDHKDVLLGILRVWYHDDNALVRQKVRAAMVEHFSSLLSAILRQGIQEGVFSTPYPEHVAQVVVVLRMGLSETLAGLLLSLDPQPVSRAHVEGAVAVYTDTIERALGIPGAGLQIVDAGILETWFT